MYDEFICEAIPLLIGGYEFREHNKKQLARSASYYELHGDIEKAEEIREIIKKY